MKKALLLGALALIGCSQGAGPATTTSGPSGEPALGEDLAARAYVVSRDTDDVTVIDLRTLRILGSVRTGGGRQHMAELNADLSKLYVSSPATSETIVVDARALAVTSRVPTAKGSTHVTLSKDGSLVAVVGEEENAVSFIDTARDVEVKRVGGFYTPHFVRFAPDGRYAYVANIGAWHLSRVDLRDLSIDGAIGIGDLPVPTEAPGESGFADAQIDGDGVLWAAHARAGRVLVYDTVAQTKLREVAVGAQPWMVYAEHPFRAIAARLVPNLGDATVSVLQRDAQALAPSIAAGDRESYGVNYSPLAPTRAWVMNRARQEIAVVDTTKGERVASIPVGGNTETASTTPDGKWIVATVSSANRVVVIDARTNQIVKTFDGVGRYPWSVTIPRGQNYCH